MYMKDLYSRLKMISKIQLFYSLTGILALSVVFFYTNLTSNPFLTVAVFVTFTTSVLFIDWLNIKLNRKPSTLNFWIIKSSVFFYYIILVVCSSMIMLGAISSNVVFELPEIILITILISYFPSLIIYIVKEISNYRLIEYFDFGKIRRVALITMLLIIQIGDNGSSEYILGVVIVVGFILTFGELTNKFEFDLVQPIRKIEKKYLIHPSNIKQS